MNDTLTLRPEQEELIRVEATRRGIAPQDALNAVVARGLRSAKRDGEKTATKGIKANPQEQERLRMVLMNIHTDAEHEEDNLSTEEPRMSAVGDNNDSDYGDAIVKKFRRQGFRL